jgi:hypothetical protein
MYMYCSYICICIYFYSYLYIYTFIYIFSHIGAILIDVLEGFDISISTLNEVSCRIISLSGLYIYIYIYIICIHIYTYTYNIYIYVYIYIYIHIYICIYIYVYIYVYIYISLSGGLSKCCIWLRYIIKDDKDNPKNLTTQNSHKISSNTNSSVCTEDTHIRNNQYIYIVTILLAKMGYLFKKLHLYSEATKAKCFTTIKPGKVPFIYFKLLSYLYIYMYIFI